jgi:hypothetical protein
MKTLKYLAFAVAVIGLVGVGLYEVRQVWAGCWIAWDGDQPTCLPVDSSSHEIDATEIVTSWVSQNMIPWTLYQSGTPGANQHLVSYGPLSSSPETTLIDSSDCPFGDSSGCAGVAPVTITCTHDGGNVDGLFQLSAWSTNMICADAHDVTIKKPGASCP